MFSTAPKTRKREQVSVSYAREIMPFTIVGGTTSSSPLMGSSTTPSFCSPKTRGVRTVISRSIDPDQRSAAKWSWPVAGPSLKRSLGSFSPSAIP